MRLDNYPPKRIVSLVPSQTELLHDLGLEDEVVGITKFCVHPRSWFETKKRVGGTKAVHIDVVKNLEPDLIIANKEENVKEQVEELAAIAPVWTSDIHNLDDAIDMIEQVGSLVNKKEKTEELTAQIKTNFSKLNNPVHPIGISLHKPKVAYLIWRDPYITAGGDTFISDMITRCGFLNAFSDEARYPVTTISQLAEKGCLYIFLSSEPYPFKPKHTEEIRQQLPGAKVIFVDGEMFSWYGSRLLLATQYFKELKSSIL